MLFAVAVAAAVIAAQEFDKESKCALLRNVPSINGTIFNSQIMLLLIFKESLLFVYHSLNWKIDDTASN